MKRLFAILTFCLLAFQVQAQDVALLNRIKATNGQVRSFEADLSNTMTKSDGSTTQTGKLYFVAPQRFAALFNNGKYMIVNERKIKLNIGMFSGTFRLREGGSMRALSNIFLYGFQGRVQELADDNNYSMVITVEGGLYVITGTIRKRPLFGIGYENVIFKYHTGSLLLKEIELRDFSGNVDTYTISNVQYGVSVDPNRFEF